MKNKSRTLQEHLQVLSTDKLRKMHSSIVDAGIVFELNGNYKSVFKKMREQATGKEKKIYSALAKAQPHEAKQFVDAITQGV